SGLNRAEPKTVTHGPTKWRRRKPVRNSHVILSRSQSSLRRSRGPARSSPSLTFRVAFPQRATSPVLGALRAGSGTGRGTDFLSGFSGSLRTGGVLPEGETGMGVDMVG